MTEFAPVVVCPVWETEAKKRLAGGPAMVNTEEAAEGWRDREFAKKFVENLGRNDRVTVYRRVDPETGGVEETYTLYKPYAEPEPIFKSGDCAAVKQAIDSKLLQPTGEVTYKKRERVRNPAQD
jgi:hypothetical protein